MRIWLFQRSLRTFSFACFTGAIACSLIAGTQVQEEPASPRLKRLLSEGVKPTPTAVEEFWKSMRQAGTPLIEWLPDTPEHRLVTFLLRDASYDAARLESNILALQSNFVGQWEALSQMRRLPGSDIWYLSIRIPADVRAPYQFAVRATGSKEFAQIVDPLNANTLWPGSRYAQSILEMPSAEPQPWVANLLPEKGLWQKLEIPSATLGGNQEVWVYLPSGYDEKQGPFDVLLGLGAATFRHAIPADTIVENLTATGRIPSTVIVVAEIGDPESEKQRYEPTVRFLADELLPAVRKRFSITSHPAHVTVAGTSRRGWVASYLGFRRPDVVRNVIGLSASFYWRPPEEREWEWLSSQIAQQPRVPVRFYLAVGRLETVVTPRNEGHYLLATNRHMRDVLRAKGYLFDYVEYAGVHHELNWQGELAKGLLRLRGKDR